MRNRSSGVQEEDSRGISEHKFENSPGLGFDIPPEGNGSGRLKAAGTD